MVGETSSLPVVLLVDDKPNMLSLLAKVLRRDARVVRATNGRLAVQLLSDEPIQVVVCDLKMPDMDGLEVLDATRRLRPGAQFVLMTAYASVASAVEAMRRGAYDYVTKPFEPEQVRQTVLRALGRAMAAADVYADEFEPLPGVVGRAPVMGELTRLVRRVASSDATALVVGETGTGKELVARALHTLGPRSSGRFVAVNCAAIPNELIESELFGHVRGAFTGADRDRAGLFEEAHGGTLFLDEVGELRPSLQAKLTRALEERKVRRVGDSRERPVDVRLVAATHRDLDAMAREGSFREDLLYRLRVATIALPPLRDRIGDVALLAAHFLGDAASQPHEPRLVGFSPPALDAMTSYSWPGNVRELRAAVDRAAIVADGPRVELRDLPPEIRNVAPSPPDPDLGAMTYQAAMELAREDSTRRYLESVLARTGGRVAAAASIAGIERESFYRLLRRYGVSADEFRRKP